MARTITAAERAAVASGQFAAFSKLEITDPDGTWRDVSTGLSGVDWLDAVTISDDLDQNAATLSGALLRAAGLKTLAPFRTDSIVNRNIAGNYAPALDLWRKWRASTAIMPKGYVPNGSDWKELNAGRMDVIEVGDDEITIQGRSEDAVFLDTWIAVERQYGSTIGVAVETVLQQMLDDNLGTGRANVGSSGYTVNCPVSPSVLLNTWTLPIGNFGQALADVAGNAKGFIFRMVYDASNVQRPTLFLPNRSASVEVFTIGPAEYSAVTLNRIDLTGMRNLVKLTYADATTGKQTVYSPKNTGTVACVAGAATFSTSQAGVIGNGSVIVVHGLSGCFVVSAFNGTTGCTLATVGGGAPTFSASNWGTSASLNQYQKRVDLEIDLSADSQVNNGTNAQAEADAIVADTSFPSLEQQFESMGAWFVQLWDYGKFLANGVHYDTDQFGGVTSLVHSLANASLLTTIGARGKPAGRYTTWRTLGRETVAGGTPLTFAECVARITATSATTVTVTVTGNPASPPQQVQLVGVTGGATLLSGAAPGTWVAQDGVNNVWVFNRAVINGGVGQAQFRSGNTSSFPNDDDLVTIEEQGRDTVYLAMRARVVSNTATTVVVRVAVADPYPQGAGSAAISYTEQGTGAATTPATGSTVTPAATLTEAAGTFVDYTVTRPAFGLGPGRVTFTATAANRTTDSDAVDIPPVDRDTVPLTIRARIISQTSLAVVVRVAIADPFPQGAASATIGYTEQGTGAATSPATGSTTTPDATLTENAGTFVDFTITRPVSSANTARVTFTGTAANRTSATASVDVPMSYAGQGSVVPTPVDKSLFAFSSGGATSGQMWLSWTWGTFTIYRPDGSTISVPASSALPAPPSPVLSQVVAGALAGRTRFVRIAYVKNQMMMRVGAEASLAISANNLLKVTSPAVTGYDGWVPLVGSASNAEFTQSSALPSAAIPFGTDWTEPVGGADIAGQTPYDSAWLAAVTAFGLNAGIPFFYYAWWEVSAGFVAFADRGQTVQVASSAAKQSLDGRIALTTTGMSATTAAAGGSNSGANIGSGKFV